MKSLLLVVLGLWSGTLVRKLWGRRVNDYITLALLVGAAVSLLMGW